MKIRIFRGHPVEKLELCCSFCVVNSPDGLFGVYFPATSRLFMPWANLQDTLLRPRESPLDELHALHCYEKNDAARLGPE